MSYWELIFFLVISIISAIILFRLSSMVFNFWLNFGLVGIKKEFNYNLNDLAVAFSRAVTEQFGENKFLGLRKGLTLRESVNFSLIKVGVGKEAKAVKGFVEIEGIAGYFIVGGPEGEPLLSAYVKKKHEEKARDIFKKVQENLDSASIYKGKIFNLPSGDFIDLGNTAGIENEVVYNEKVLSDLESQVFTIFEKSELCLHVGIRLQRKVLFLGKFGSGKTLATLIAGRRANKEGWTVIYAEPTIQAASRAVSEIINFSKRYQPVMIIFEDFDREQRGGDQFALGLIMSAMDNITTKDSKILMIMTTNYPERIEAGIQRPGRIDKFIDFNLFSAEDIKRLILKLIPKEMVQKDINWSEILRSCEGYAPAFVHEVATTAKLSAISKNDGSKPIVTGGMLMEASEELRKRHKKCSNALGFSKDIKG